MIQTKKSIEIGGIHDQSYQLQSDDVLSRKQEVYDDLFNEMKKFTPIYACFIKNRGCEPLRAGLIERAVAIGVVSALIANTIYGPLVDPPEMENEAFQKIGQGIYSIAFGLCYVNISLSTIQVAALNSLMVSDLHFMEYIIQCRSYLPIPEGVMALTALSTALATAFIIYGDGGMGIGLFYLLSMFALFAVWFWFQWKQMEIIFETMNSHLCKDLQLPLRDSLNYSTRKYVMFTVFGLAAVVISVVLMIIGEDINF